MSLHIYEREEYCAGGGAALDPPALLYTDLREVGLEFKKIRSAHGNFLGGRVITEGAFNHGFYKRVVIKMDEKEYLRLGRLLKQLFSEYKAKPSFSAAKLFPRRSALPKASCSVGLY